MDEGTPRSCIIYRASGLSRRSVFCCYPSFYSDCNTQRSSYFRGYSRLRVQVTYVQVVSCAALNPQKVNLDKSGTLTILKYSFMIQGDVVYLWSDCDYVCGMCTQLHCLRVLFCLQVVLCNLNMVNRYCKGILITVVTVYIFFGHYIAYAITFNSADLEVYSRRQGRLGKRKLVNFVHIASVVWYIIRSRNRHPYGRKHQAAIELSSDYIGWFLGSGYSVAWQLNLSSAQYLGGWVLVIYDCVLVLVDSGYNILARSLQTGM